MRSRAGAAGQEPEAVLQAQELSSGSTRTRAGGQLDGQRDAVEPVADLGHRRGALGGHSEGGLHRHRPVDEQPHRLGLRQRRDGSRPLGLLEIGEGEGGHAPGGLPGDPEGLPAGGQDGDARTAPEQGVDEAGAGVEQVLAVVQHQQQPLGLQGLRQRRGQRPAGFLAHAHGHGYRLGHQPGVASSRHLGQRPLPAHEAGQLRGQVVAQRVQGAQSREVAGEARVHQLEHSLRPGQVLEPVGAQVAQPHLFWEVVLHHLCHCGREHHLPPVRSTHEARAAVERRPEVVGPLALHLAQVHPHPRSQRPRRAPGLPVQGPLPGQGGRTASVGRAKAAYTASPTVSKTTPPEASTAPCREVVVAGHGPPVGGGVGLQQAGAALQVGEQERHRPLGQCPRRAHRSPPPRPQRTQQRLPRQRGPLRGTMRRRSGAARAWANPWANRDLRQAPERASPASPASPHQRTASLPLLVGASTF